MEPIYKEDWNLVTTPKGTYVRWNNWYIKRQVLHVHNHIVIKKNTGHTYELMIAKDYKEGREETKILVHTLDYINIENTYTWIKSKT